MIKQGKYRIVKDIPLKGNQPIKAGTDIYLLNNIFMMDGIMLPPSYQEDFRQLFLKESTKGWNYIQPIDVV